MTAADAPQLYELVDQGGDSGAVYPAGLGREEHLACERACLGICTTISEDSGTTRGRKDRECGAMGVISVPAAATQGCREHAWVREQHLAVMPIRKDRTASGACCTYAHHVC